LLFFNLVFSFGRLIEYALPEGEEVVPISYVAFQTGWGAFGYWGVSSDLGKSDEGIKQLTK
jgi:hypothetical protein